MRCSPLAPAMVHGPESPEAAGFAEEIRPLSVVIIRAISKMPGGGSKGKAPPNNKGVGASDAQPKIHCYLMKRCLMLALCSWARLCLYCSLPALSS